MRGATLCLLAFFLAMSSGCYWSEPGRHADHSWTIELPPQASDLIRHQQVKFKAEALTQRREIFNLSFAISHSHYDRNGFQWDASNPDAQAGLQGNAVTISRTERGDAVTTISSASPLNYSNSNHSPCVHFLIRSEGDTSHFANLDIWFDPSDGHDSGERTAACFHAEDGRRIEMRVNPSAQVPGLISTRYRLIASSGQIVAETGPLNRQVVHEKYKGMFAALYENAIVVNGRPIEETWAEMKLASQ